jgi:hypothetical protein
LQQATPTTFGAKAATWLDAIARSRLRLTTAMEAALELQFGGATGTLSSLGSAGQAVAKGLAARLHLRVPDIPWHTERGRIVNVACALGMTCGSLGKIGRDIALLSQTEVGEVREPSSSGRGASSSMPHKRNPVASAVAAAAAVQAPGLVATMLSAMPQEHEARDRHNQSGGGTRPPPPRSPNRFPHLSPPTNPGMLCSHRPLPGLSSELLDRLGCSRELPSTKVAPQNPFTGEEITVLVRRIDLEVRFSHATPPLSGALPRSL